MAGKHALRGIPGRAPVPGRRPAGCFFAARCDDAGEQCHESFPPYDGPDERHRVRCFKWRTVQSRPMFADRPLRVVAGASCASDDDALIAVRDVRAFYGTHEILHGIDATVCARRCIALVGESGSGKTTLARAIAGIHPGRIEGEILFGGRKLERDSRARSKESRQKLQYIFQSPYGSLNPRKTVGQIIGQPLKQFYKLSWSETERRMTEALELVALDGTLLAKYPDQLSGGERQRVAIARALAAEPSVLICDEVTSSLDVSVQATIIELLARLIAETGVGMIFVTHHLPLVRSIAQEVAVMSEGRIVEYGTVDEVLANPQADYTRGLLADTPTI
jgi:peptide/nickel transport system ATP-binding protein